MLPAGVITSVDPDDQAVSVNRTKEQIKRSRVRREPLPRRGLPGGARFLYDVGGPGSSGDQF